MCRFLLCTLENSPVSNVISPDDLTYDSETFDSFEAGAGIADLLYTAEIRVPRRER